MKLSTIATLVSFGLAAVLLFIFAMQADAQSVTRPRACTVSTSTAITIGAQASTMVLATSSNRAWASIMQPSNASSTAFLSFDEGAAAAVGAGYRLGTTTTSVYDITFGVNTTFPYNGAVTARTDTASTTVLVTECVYPY